MAGQSQLQRYLLQFSYKGTRFSGLQKQTHRPLMAQLTQEEAGAVYSGDQGSVQGALEAALWTFARPVNNLVVLQCSSRTDSGVHALCNTAHCDLAPGLLLGGFPSPREITGHLNKAFIHSDVDVRVLKTLAVPPDFHARHHVISRSYLYRLAVLPPHSIVAKHKTHKLAKHQLNNADKRRRKRWIRNLEEQGQVGCHVSLLEEDRVHVVRQYVQSQEFNLELFREAMSKMEGTHNFCRFVKSQGLLKYRREGREYKAFDRTEEELTKTVSIRVEEVAPPFPSSVYPSYSHIKFVDVIVEGKSFLHNQIRRMVGLGISVAMGRVDLGLVDRLLSGEEASWNPVATPASPEGLYLARVEYPASRLELATERFSEMMAMEKVVRERVEVE